MDISNIREKYNRLEEKVNNLKNREIALKTEVKTISEDIKELTDELLEMTGKSSLEEVVEYYKQLKSDLTEKIEKLNQELDSYLDSDDVIISDF